MLVSTIQVGDMCILGGYGATSWSSQCALQPTLCEILRVQRMPRKTGGRLKSTTSFLSAAPQAECGDSGFGFERLHIGWRRPVPARFFRRPGNRLKSAGCVVFNSLRIFTAPPAW